MGTYSELSKLDKTQLPPGGRPAPLAKARAKSSKRSSSATQPQPSKHPATADTRLPSARLSMEPGKPASHTTAKPASPIASQQASHMTILQWDDAEIEELRAPAYQAQTYRLTADDIERVKDMAYRLSKEIKRGKVSQADIIRIAIRLFENLLAVDKAGLLKLLNAMK